METLAGKALSDLALLVSEKWYAAMGLVGLIILMWVLVKGTPNDAILVGTIAVAMIGIGFGEGESRTFRQAFVPGYQITEKVRRMNGVSIALYCVGGIGALTAIGRSIYLLW